MRRLSPPEDYEQCDHCGTWRPKTALQPITTLITIANGETTTETTPGCRDRAWCEAQNERRKGNTT